MSSEANIWLLNLCSSKSTQEYCGLLSSSVSTFHFVLYGNIFISYCYINSLWGHFCHLLWCAAGLFKLFSFYKDNICNLLVLRQPTVQTACKLQMCTCTVLAQIKRGATSPPRPTVRKWSQNICWHQMEPEFVQWGSGRTCLYTWCTSQRFTTFMYHYWLIQTKLTNISAIWHKTICGRHLRCTVCF